MLPELSLSLFGIFSFSYKGELPELLAIGLLLLMGSLAIRIAFPSGINAFRQFRRHTKQAVSFIRKLWRKNSA